MDFYLEAKTGPLAGAKFAIRRRIIIGRDPEADVQLISSGVSRQHAALILDDADDVFIMDLASKNGTFVRGASVGRERLSPGDSFRIGDSDFVLHCAEMSLPLEVDEPVMSLHLASGPAIAATVDGHPLTAEEIAEVLRTREKG